MTMFVLAAALAAAAPAPAPAPAPVAPVAAATPQQSAVEPGTDMRRFCIVDTITGSRLARQSCQTRADWLAEGFDPLAKR